MLRKIYNRLYDLEKQYFRSTVSQKKSKQKQEEANKELEENSGSPPRRKDGGGSVSVLGAVAAGARHLARRKSQVGGDQDTAEDMDRPSMAQESGIFAQGRKSLVNIGNFIKRTSKYEKSDKVKCADTARKMIFYGWYLKKKNAKKV